MSVKATPYRVTQRLRECLQKINKEYAEGCVGYYESSGEWQRAFDEMDKSLLKDTEILIMNKIVWFEKTILALASRYKLMKQKADQMGLSLGG